MDLLDVAPVEVHHKILIITRRALNVRVLLSVRRMHVIIPVVYGVGLAYVATVEFAWNPLAAIAGHVSSLDAGVTPGTVATLLISSQIDRSVTPSRHSDFGFSMT